MRTLLGPNEIEIEILTKKLVLLGVGEKRLKQSIVYFLSNVLKNCDQRETKIRIVILDDRLEEGRDPYIGRIFVVDRVAHCQVNLDRVVRAADFASMKKSFFFVLLNMFGRLSNFFEVFSWDKEESPRECFQKIQRDNEGKILQLKKRHVDYTESQIEMINPMSLFADQFAFDHLFQFETLYKYNGRLTPH